MTRSSRVPSHDVAPHHGREGEGECEERAVRVIPNQEREVFANSCGNALLRCFAHNKVCLCLAFFVLFLVTKRDAWFRSCKHKHT
jgi:hypothetical protein